MKNLITKHLLLSILLLLVVLCSCEDNQDEVAPINKPDTDSTTVDTPDSIPTATIRPGGFAVSRLVDVPNGRSAATVPHQVKFDLGDIKASREFLFLLSNSGDFPVFDISIATDHPQFRVSPQRIDTLRANGSTDNLLPLVSVGVEHGVALNGIGRVALLEQGAHTGTVTIRGKTIVANDTVEVVAEVEMKVEAKVADIDMYVNEILLNLSEPDVNVVGASRSYGYEVSKNSEIKIVNTGNVPIVLKYTAIRYDNLIVTVLDEELTLDLGESESFNISSSDNVKIVLDAQNTVMNHEEIVQETDGRGNITLIPNQ